MTETEKKLILFELVKIDDKNMRSIPFHDLYRLIFRQKFEFKFIDSVDIETDIYINTKKAVTVPNQDNISKAISQLQQWKAEGRFYAMLYVLEGVFETSQKNSLRYEIGDEAYFMLYLYYTMYP